MPGFLIVLDILPGVRLLSAEETWRQRFAQCVMKVTAPEATHTCKYGHICLVLKWEYMGKYTGFNIFGTLTILRKISIFYL